MADFIQFKKAVKKQFDLMSKSGLFVTDIGKDDLWDAYLVSFPEGTNPVFRERTEHDCQCCKQFIRNIGNVVAIVNNKMVSVWDINVGGTYQVVADALSLLVKSGNVADVFLHVESSVGMDHNFQEVEDGTPVKWDHFHVNLLSQFVVPGANKGTILSEKHSTKDVFKRGLDEITLDAANTILELINQNSLYRGEEHTRTVKTFLKHKKAFDKLGPKEQDFYAWTQSVILGGAARIRSTVIGTLMVDISNSVPLDDAVKMFESKVAPQNYKRPTALITKSMIANAQAKVEELGITESLSRRYAVQGDITINNVLFADRSVKKAMNVFDEMMNEAPTKVGNLGKVEEISITDFVRDVLPTVSSMEVLLENSKQNNFVSLVSPQQADAEPIFKWGNNFSWAYNGEVADSMKERVKKAGGNVTGVLRFSIQWNDGDNNQNDFDAHCIEPSSNLIYYSSKNNRQTTGQLDVDITDPGRDIAVENITWSNKDKMLEGRYRFLVHNYSHNGGKTGFTAEVEYDGIITSFAYNKELRNNEKVEVAEIDFSKKTGIKFLKSLPSTTASREIWGLQTGNFHKVTMVMNSPNHWDGNETGNKHFFFMLENCVNDGQVRGFFNEFLTEDLTKHRKVFEVLGSKMRVAESDNQLSGLGFSSTQRNQITCKVTGAFTRMLKITF